MGQQPEPGAGDVMITLAGKEHVMKPTLEACMAISRYAGGTAKMVQRCLNLDFDAICETIALGTGYTSGMQRKQIQEAVYETGMIAVAADCALFIRAINNAGKLPSDDEGEGEGDQLDPLSNESALESSTTD